MKPPEKNGYVHFLGDRLAARLVSSVRYTVASLRFINLAGLLLLAVAVCFSALPAQAEARSKNSKHAALVIHESSGEVLYSYRMAKRLYPASLTKMMTLYMAFDALDRHQWHKNTRLGVSARAARQPATHLRVRVGSSITVDQAIKALIILSANDVAVVVAEALGGSEARFARLMTRKAHKLGMSQTAFRNASGLPNAYMKSSARDMAILAQRLIQDFPQYYAYFSQKSFTYAGRTYHTHNHFLRAYTGAEGMKTGFTRKSGFNLVAAATRKGERLITVVFGEKNPKERLAHASRLMDKGFSRLKKYRKRFPPAFSRPAFPRMKDRSAFKALVAARSDNIVRPLRKPTLHLAAFSADASMAPGKSDLKKVASAPDYLPMRKVKVAVASTMLQTAASPSKTDKTDKKTLRVGSTAGKAKLVVMPVAKKKINRPPLRVAASVQRDDWTAMTRDLHTAPVSDVIARMERKQMERAGVQLTPFAPPPPSGN